MGQGSISQNLALTLLVLGALTYWRLNVFVGALSAVFVRHCLHAKPSLPREVVAHCIVCWFS